MASHALNCLGYSVASTVDMIISWKMVQFFWLKNCLIILIDAHSHARVMRDLRPVLLVVVV